MKKIIPLFIACAILVGCEKENTPIQQQNKILLLRIDYLTYQFEGAFEQTLSSPFAPFDSLPISNVFQSPGDFGNLKLFYQPNNELIFDGDIVWNGWGPINYPTSFSPPANYLHTGLSLSLPDSSRFQNVFPQWHYPKLPLDSIWMNIGDLAIVKEYNASPKNIGFLLYTPSVGVGDPAQWDWFLVFNQLD